MGADISGATGYEHVKIICHINEMLLTSRPSRDFLEHHGHKGHGSASHSSSEAGEAIDLVDDDRVDPSGLDIVQERVQEDPDSRLTST